MTALAIKMRSAITPLSSSSTTACRRFNRINKQTAVNQADSAVDKARPACASTGISSKFKPTLTNKLQVAIITGPFMSCLA